MAIMKVIRAKDTDTLCSIGFDNGFKNCTKLRDANPDLAARQVAIGDRVNVPEVTQKEEPGQTELRHRFKRLGEKNQVFIIQDFNKPTPEGALADRQRQLAVSNYVPGRQGRGFTTADWVDETFFGHDPDATADPDHFKIQVHDPFASARNESEVNVTLQAQQPVLNSRNEIERWDDMADPGAKLPDIVCRQVEPDSPWYRSHYLRLVTDTQDHTCHRPHGRNDAAGGNVDAGKDVSKQTVIVPPLDDRNIEILDLRVEGFRPATLCEAGDPTAPQHCRARAFSDVGKDEKALRMKIVRIGGEAGTGITVPDIHRMVFINTRKHLAQINVGCKLVEEPGPGVTIVDGFIHDVPEPNNMIAISDFDGVTATGGADMTAEVDLATGRVTATITTRAGHRPERTANRLADELRRLGVKCVVSKNPPITSSRSNFGSCDILCFNPDDTPARIISTNSDDATQDITDSGGWNNASITNLDAYTAPRVGDEAIMIGFLDYRSAAKNYVKGTSSLCIVLVNGFASASLLGEATGPYFGLSSVVRPVPEYQFVLFLDQGGVAAEAVLAHEGGHVLLDCFHTTFDNAPAGAATNEVDNFGNPYDNNTNLGFSEWMSAFVNTNPFNKRISDGPLTVSLTLLDTSLLASGQRRRTVNTVDVLMGQTAPTRIPTCTERFRDLCRNVFQGLRQLRPEPPPPV